MPRTAAHISRRASCLGRARLALSFIALLLAASLGCAQPQTSLPEAAASPDAPAALAASMPLPAPSQLPHGGAAAVPPAGQFLDRPLWNAYLPYQGLHQYEGLHYFFDPVDENSGLAGCAYAGYNVRVDSFAQCPPEIELHWKWALTADMPCWLGLANWGADRWDWLSVPVNGRLLLDEIQPYFDSEGDLMLMVLLGGGLNELEWLRIGSNLPPEYTGFRQQISFGACSVRVSRDTGYDRDGEIVYWEWDFAGDSQPEQQGGETAEYTYEAPGEYSVRLTVYDNDGASSTYTGIVTASPWELLPLSGNYIRHSTLAASADGVAHLLGSDSSGSLRHYWHDGNSLQQEVLLQLDNACQNLALALAADSSLRALAVTATHYASGDYRWWYIEPGPSGYSGKEIAALAGTTCYSAQLVLDADGEPHLLGFELHDETRRLLYAVRTDGAWQLEEVPYGSGSLGESSLALTASGAPAIACGIEQEGLLLRYLVKQGSDWLPEDVAGDSWYSNVERLRFDSQGRAVILASVDGSACLARRETGGWQVYYAADQLESWTVRLDGGGLELAPDGSAQIVLGTAGGDWGIPGETRLLSFDWLNWQQELVCADGSSSVSIALTPAGQPWVAAYGSYIGVVLARRLP